VRGDGYCLVDVECVLVNRRNNAEDLGAHEEPKQTRSRSSKLFVRATCDSYHSIVTSIAQSCCLCVAGRPHFEDLARSDVRKPVPKLDYPQILFGQMPLKSRASSLPSIANSVAMSRSCAACDVLTSTQGVEIINSCRLRYRFLVYRTSKLSMHSCPTAAAPGRRKGFAPTRDEAIDSMISPGHAGA
jgi:hypothetical protein